MLLLFVIQLEGHKRREKREGGSLKLFMHSSPGNERRERERLRGREKGKKRFSKRAKILSSSITETNRCIIGISVFYGPFLYLNKPEIEP